MLIFERTFVSDYFALKDSKNMKSVVFYGFQFAHHGDHSAFSALKKQLLRRKINVICALRPQFLWNRGVRRLLPIWMKLQEQRLNRFYNSDSIKSIHYFFPENSLFNGHNKKGNKKLILTCHQPAKKETFDLLRNQNVSFIKGLKKADVIMLMASTGIEAYKKLAPQAKVICIPHGIDVRFFNKKHATLRSQITSNRYNILTVGNWLRDYEYWSDVVKELLKSGNEFSFNVIAGVDSHEKIKNAFKGSVPTEIKMHTGISDESLRNHYAKADILFLPLKDAWANNALLEAAAMECPVMVTNLPAVREYLGDDLALCFDRKYPIQTAQQIIKQLNNKQKMLRLGKKLRLRMIQHFSWEKIADKYIQLYQELNCD